MRFLVSLFLVSSFVADSSLSAEALMIYSSRKDHLISPLIQEYKNQTGSEIKLVTDTEAALMKRLEVEGKKTPADIFMTVDAGNLWQAAERDLLAMTQSEILNRNIPAYLRDDRGRWFGLSVRARTIFYNPNLVKPEELVGYEDLASKKWRGRLCLRTSKKVYNQSLVASMVEHYGEQKAERIVEGWVGNLARDVFSNDTSLLEAINAGQCAVGVANTYYFGRLVRDNPNFKVKVFFPKMGDGAYGTHVNISGAGVVKASNQKAEAQKFLEWLSSGRAQQMFAQLNLEYPANPSVEQDPLVASWGEFEADRLQLQKLGEKQTLAIRLMDRAHYR